MPKNLIALLRYETIDNCLRNTARRYTLQHLRMECAKALKEKLNKDDIPAERTMLLDIKNMKSGILGYYAPIKNKRSGKGPGYYVYTDSDFSIKNYSLDDDEVKALYKSLDILQHFSEFDFQKKAMKAIKKLMKEICPELPNNDFPIIGISRVKEAEGWNLIDKIYHAIEDKQVLSFEFRHFRSDEGVQKFQEVHPYHLHEYNNRWFLFALCKNENEDYVICKFGLERLYNIENNIAANFIPNKKFMPENYFKNKIGVSQGFDSNQTIEEVILSFPREKGLYVLSKPIHPSQEVILENDLEIQIKLSVIINYELIREVISFMNGVKVITPQRLKNEIKKVLHEGWKQYDEYQVADSRAVVPFLNYTESRPIDSVTSSRPGPAKNNFQQLDQSIPEKFDAELFERIRNQIQNKKEEE